MLNHIGYGCFTWLPLQFRGASFFENRVVHETTIIITLIYLFNTFYQVLLCADAVLCNGDSVVSKTESTCAYGAYILVEEDRQKPRK